MDYQLNYEHFSLIVHQQPYLIGADKENYPLINHSLATAIVSKTSGFSVWRE
jgi:hypothetical protein